MKKLLNPIDAVKMAAKGDRESLGFLGFLGAPQPDANPIWETTSTEVSTECVTEYNDNTGYAVKTTTVTQTDVNPHSETFNQTRTETSTETVEDLVSCPLPHKGNPISAYVNVNGGFDADESSLGTCTFQIGDQIEMEVEGVPQYMTKLYVGSLSDNLVLVSLEYDDQDNAVASVVPAGSYLLADMTPQEIEAAFDNDPADVQLMGQQLEDIVVGFTSESLTYGELTAYLSPTLYAMQSTKIQLKYGYMDEDEYVISDDYITGALTGTLSETADGLTKISFASMTALVPAGAESAALGYDDNGTFVSLASGGDVYVDYEFDYMTIAEGFTYPIDDEFPMFADAEMTIPVIYKVEYSDPSQNEEFSEVIISVI